MESMCKSPYDAKWGGLSSCPSLELIQKNGSPFNVSVLMDQTHDQVLEQYSSLPDFWSSWYRMYLEDNRPRLFVRYEDLLYHAPVVLREIAGCVGIEVPDKINYFTTAAKKHGDSHDLLESLRRYASPEARIRHLSRENLQYAVNALDSELIDLLHYKLPR